MPILPIPVIIHFINWVTNEGIADEDADVCEVDVELVHGGGDGGLVLCLDDVGDLHPREKRVGQRDHDVHLGLGPREAVIATGDGATNAASTGGGRRLLAGSEQEGVERQWCREACLRCPGGGDEGGGH